MTAPDLKPCPFCGGIAYLRDDSSHSTAYFIGCATEDCFGEIHWGQNEAEAVTAWNTRAPLAEALAVPEELAKQIIDRSITRLQALPDHAGRPAWDAVVAEEIRATFRAIGEGKA